jgi:hypothetical protein
MPVFGLVAPGTSPIVYGWVDDLLALSVLMHRMGVRSRLGGVTAAAVVAVPLVFDAIVLNILPRFVLSGR